MYGPLDMYGRLLSARVRRHVAETCACTRQALYLLLVTNKASNILEDLETLRLLAKVVPEYVPSLDEEGVSQAAFELLFAFDEARRFGQYLLAVNLRILYTCRMMSGFGTEILNAYLA